jgi:hypothetical protein
MEFTHREGTPSEQTCFVSSGAADITTPRIVGRLTGPDLPTKPLWAQNSKSPAKNSLAVFAKGPSVRHSLFNTEDMLTKQ